MHFHRLVPLVLSSSLAAAAVGTTPTTRAPVPCQKRVLAQAEKERLRDEARRMREYEKARAAQERESRKMEARLEKEKKMEERKQMMEV